MLKKLYQEILSREANNPACQMLITSNKEEHEDSKSNGWNIVKKIKKRKTNLKIIKEKKSSKTLAKFAKIPCRNYPDCKWKNECWYMHKDEFLSIKLDRCQNAKVENLSHQKKSKKGDISTRKITAKKSENIEGNGCDEEKRSIGNHLKKIFPCQNINEVNETIDVNMCSDGDYTKKENKPPKL